jgi:hypothetical protein
MVVVEKPESGMQSGHSPGVDMSISLQQINLKMWPESNGTSVKWGIYLRLGKDNFRQKHWEDFDGCYLTDLVDG